MTDACMPSAAVGQASPEVPTTLHLKPSTRSSGLGFIPQKTDPSNIRKSKHPASLRGSRSVLSCEKWKSQLLTLSDQDIVTDLSVRKQLCPTKFLRTVGRSQNFTLTPTRPVLHERTGREPRSNNVKLKLYTAVLILSPPTYE
jgi:hypothetical protein